MGLCNLKYINEILAKRKILSDHYDLSLKNLEHSKPLINCNSNFNHSYYPIILENDKVVKKMIKNLNDNQIFPRRYFFPSLNTSLPYIENSIMPISDELSSRVITLPLYYDLSLEEIDFICRIMLRTQNT
jgi:dTDP-4-amino-4,6-dideoxygalactose transaminase